MALVNPVPWILAAAGVLLSATALAPVRLRLRVAARAFPPGTAPAEPVGLRVAAAGAVGLGPLRLSLLGRARLAEGKGRTTATATLWAGPARLARLRVAKAASIRLPPPDRRPSGPGLLRRPPRRQLSRPPAGPLLPRPHLARTALRNLLTRLAWRRVDVSVLLGAGDAMATALGAAALRGALAAVAARLLPARAVNGPLRLDVWPHFQRTALAARADVVATTRAIWLAVAAFQGLRALRGGQGRAGTRLSGRAPTAPCRR